MSVIYPSCFCRRNCKGWRMVKSETRRDAEILVRNPSPRLFEWQKVSRLKKSKNKPCKNEISRLVKNASEISRSCQNLPRLTFFEVPFATPTIVSTKWLLMGDSYAWKSNHQGSLPRKVSTHFLFAREFIALNF